MLTDMGCETVKVEPACGLFYCDDLEESDWPTAITHSK